MSEPLSVRVSDQRQAEALARELRDLVRFDLQKSNGHWELTVPGVLGDKQVVCVLNAIRQALAGAPSSRAVVLLDGREYDLDPD